MAGIKFGWLSVAIFLTAVGCTKTTPEFAVLDQNNIPQPMFNGSTSMNAILTSATETFAIQGQCDPKIHAIEAMVVGPNSGFVSANAISNSGFTLACATSGTFSMTLKTLAGLGLAVVENSNYEIDLRAVTAGGISNSSRIHLHYSTAGATGPKRLLLTSGATASSSAAPRIATSPNFKAEVRVDHMLNDYSSTSSQDAMALKTSTNFRMKTGPAAEND